MRALAKVDHSLEIDQLFELEQQAKALDREIKRRRVALLETLQASGVRETAPTHAGHIARVVESERETISVKLARAVLAADVVEAITVKSTVEYLKVS